MRAAGAKLHALSVENVYRMVEGGFVLPDLMVIDAPEPGQHPSSAELVIEVAITTLRSDREKSRRYARAGVGEFWIVDPRGRNLSVHTAPGTDGYRVVESHDSSSYVPTPVGAPPVSVSEVLAAAGIGSQSS